MNDAPLDPPPSPKAGVPAELIDALRAANDRFHAARQHMDSAIDATINNLTERARAVEELAEAERRLEEVEARIFRELPPH